MPGEAVRYAEAMTPVYLRSGPELSAAELHAVLALRVAVFVVEQACPYQEVDGRDLEPGTTHRWVADSAGVAAYLRTLAEPDGTLRIGRVVTRPDARGQGLAARLIAGVLADHPAATTVLSAQSHLQSWYDGFGYEADGPELLEDGIPHRPMRRPGRPEPGVGS